MSTATSPKRILFLARGGMLDGAERQLVYLCSTLDPQRYQPLVGLDAQAPLADELRRHNIATHILPMRPWRSLRGFVRCHLDALRIARFARHHRIDLVHGSDLWKTPYVLSAARRLGIPSVIHIRGPVTPRDIRKHKLSRATGILAISERYREDLVAAGISQDRLHIAYDAIDTERFRPDSARRTVLRALFPFSQPLAVGLLGRIEPFKRILEFLEIIALAESRGGHHAFYLVIGQPGAPEYMAQVRAALQRLRLTDRVHFTGRRDDTAHLVPGLDLLVTLSGGSVLFEAMASGTPVLAVPRDHRPTSYIQHGLNAFVPATRDSALAADALVTLLHDPALRARLAGTARAWVEQHHTPSCMAAKTQALYDQLLAVPHNP